MLLDRRHRHLVPRSQFADDSIRALAQSIVATNGLLRPLIVRSTGKYEGYYEQFQVIQGALEYWAAVEAHVLNPAFEMVNAFLIADAAIEVATEQLEILAEIDLIDYAII